MAKATKQFPALLNVTGKITADEMDEEMGISYSCPIQHHHSHHNVATN
jgi:hypothetical protein